MYTEYLEAPQQPQLHHQRKPWVFLAGGITGARNWQEEMHGELERLSANRRRCTVVNPRRANFPIDDPGAAEKQIGWEFRMLQAADAIVFWFPPETLCPIALFELGKWLVSDKPLFIGTDPEYKRRQDVVIQVGLVRPKQVIHRDIAGVAREVREWLAP